MTYEEILTDANNLYEAYKASAKGSYWKESTQKFTLHYLKNIFDIQDEIKNRTLTNRPVNEFTLRERGKARPVTSLHINDRIVRHVLCDKILLPEIKKRIIYDNGASIKGRGISQQRKRFEIHLRRYYKLYGNEGYILFGDFTKFFDNIVHSISKEQILKVFNHDEFLTWLIDLIYDGFKIDVSYMSDADYLLCMTDIFNKLEYRNVPASEKTGEKWMEKSVNIGDQASQIIGAYYPHPIDNYVKYVRSQKFYGRYVDDFYIMNPDKKVLQELLEKITEIADTLGIHLNKKKTRIVKISSTYRYLGLKYTLTKTGKIIKRVVPERVTGMRRKLKKLAIKVHNGERPYSYVEDVFRSFMGNYYKLMSRSQRENMIHLFEELFNKSIIINHKKMIIFDMEPRPVLDKGSFLVSVA